MGRADVVVDVAYRNAHRDGLADRVASVLPTWLTRRC